MKPRMKNHFRAHQLSIWLRLIPELHRAGMEDVITRHNLFKNHDDLDLYDGPVKPDSIQKLYLEETLKRRGGGVVGNTSDLLGEWPGTNSMHIIHLHTRSSVRSPKTVASTASSPTARPRPSALGISLSAGRGWDSKSRL